MKFTISEKHISATEGQYQVETSSANWEGYVKKAQTKLFNKVEVPGFRKGKAPIELIKKQVSSKQIYEEAMHYLFDDVWKHIWTSNDINKRPIDMNDIDLSIKNVSAKKCEIDINFTIIPEVNVENWKKHTIKRQEPVISEEEVEHLIKEELDKHSSIVVSQKKHKLEKGNIASINFTGYLNGEKFDGGHAEDFDLEIGSGQFIPGFETQLIGMKKGETKTITVTFPENYQAKELAGKETNFEVVLNEIKEKNIPTLNDEWVAQTHNKESVTHFVDYVKQNALEKKRLAAAESLDEEILDVLVANLDIPLPEKLVRKEQAVIEKDFFNRLKERKIDKNLYLKMINKSETELLETFKDDAVNRLKIALLLQSIARAEKIEANDEDYNNFLQLMSQKYNKEVDELKKLAPFNDDIRFRLTNEKVWDLIRKTLIID
ncbi:hypothetical protein ASO20_02780 [Mycoplasma sp. (ex Biomphalaria glabrata)]|uniref:trigger factor n=1 Tax=Mycoplasma sp. (ex Biomphalaria glabrata) TaxID=1749074 RepID=UPI00073ABE34|nr:trigger factor [Mycoplasma sp. (ex Biomphalaria glabrata)]ALV23559.1 hypothetical protein ASO20_02780 [Mycoplasma sp. (ex Biomphalaria glabrata)]